MLEQSSNENYLSAQDAALMFNALYQDCFNGIGHDFLENYVRVSMSDTANTGMALTLNNFEKFMNMNGIVLANGRFNELAMVKNGNALYIISYFTDRANGDPRNQARSAAEYVSATLR